MALDLSTVNEPIFCTGESDVPSEYVLLPTECISTPGSGEVLFRISSIGQLILADFSMELHNGCYVLRRHPHHSECTSDYPELPTNLSLEKCQWTHDDRSQYGLWPSYISETADKLPTSFRAPTRILESEYPIYPLDSHDSLTQHINTAERHNSFASGHLENLASRGSFVATSEEPVDATLPRHLPPVGSEVTNLPTSMEVKTVEDSADLSILSQSVRHLLQTHGHSTIQDGSSPDASKHDVILSGHNLSSLARFTKQLTQHRLHAGMSQLQMSQELARHFNNETMFSQSLLSRFERLDVTVRAAFRLLPYLESWLTHRKQDCANSNDVDCGTSRTTSRRPRLMRLLRSGLAPPSTHDSSKHVPSSTESAQNTSESTVHHAQLIEHQPESRNSDATCQLKNPRSRPERRKRTHFSDSVLLTLLQAYEKNRHPKGAQLTRIATETGHNRESIRIWFCNRRQVEARTSEKSASSS